jgi:hypothetical protein
MSRRALVVNTLCGLFLVAVFLLPFLLVWYVLQALSLIIQHFFPAVSPRILLVAFILLSSLVSGVMRARKKQWRSVFLSFAMIPVVASMWLGDPHSPFALQSDFWILVLLPIFAFQEGPHLTRSHFFVAASAICAAIAFNAGLLGSGPLARIVAAGILVGGSLWFLIGVRRGWIAPNDPDPTAPLSSTHA